MKPIKRFKEVVESHQDKQSLSFAEGESFHITYAKISPIEQINLALQSSTDYIKSGNEIETVWVTDRTDFETTSLTNCVVLAAIDWPAQRITSYAVGKGNGTIGKRLGQVAFIGRDMASYNDFVRLLTEVLRPHLPVFIHK